MTKKVTVIGAGQVGKVLAGGFVKHGYDVTLGTHGTKPVDGWTGKTGNYAEVVEGADIVVIAVKGTGAEEVVKTIADKIKGKIVIDVTNPIAPEPPDNGVIRYFTSPNESLMERLQKLAPAAHFVKAFNSIGNAFMVNPDFGGTKPTMFYCGGDVQAKKAVAEILSQFGFEPEDMGGVEAARAIEPLCILWCIPGFLRNEWFHAFKLLKK